VFDSRLLVPGMAASADITVGKRTILSYILSPLMKFRDGAFRAGLEAPSNQLCSATDFRSINTT
jgi:hypothetical protein